MQRTYLYGRGRIPQQSGTEIEYFLGDALGSVRQLVDQNGEVTLSRDYQPYGETLSSSGAGTSVYGFTGEAADPSGLVYLQARYYSSATGRFLSRDPWDGDVSMPMSYNAWLYGYANPITLTDPSGWYPFPEIPCHLLPPDEQDECRGWFGCNNSNAFASIGVYNLSAYYITHETQYYSGKDSMSEAIPSLGNIKANKYFLFSKGGVCTQGTGKLKEVRNGISYIGCLKDIWKAGTTDGTVNNEFGQWPYVMPLEDRAYREETPYFKKDAPISPQFVPFDTVAVCSNGAIERDISGRVEIRIKSTTLGKLLKPHGGDNVFTVTDVGGGLCATKGIDIFLGEQRPYSEDPADTIGKLARQIFDINSVSVEMRIIR